MPNFPESVRRRSPGRPRGSSLASRKSANSVPRSQGTEKEFVGTPCKTRSPGRPRSPGRKGQMPKSSLQKNLEADQTSGDGSQKYGGSSGMVCSEVSRKAISEQLQEGMVVTKRTVSVDSIPANNNSNIPIATLSSNINFHNFMNVSVSERKAVFAPDSHQGSLGATYQTGNVTGERDMPKDRKILLYKDSVMVFLQKTFSFIEVFVLISVFLLLSSYLSFQSCPNKFWNFFEHLYEAFQDMLVPNYRHITGIFIFWAFICLQIFIHCLSIGYFWLLRKNARSDESALTQRAPDFGQVSGNINIAVTTSVASFTYFCFPSLPHVIVSSVHYMIVICLIKVFVIIAILRFFEYMNISKSTGVLLESRNFVMVRFGIIASMLMALTYGWCSIISDYPNHTAIMLVASQCLYLMSFMSIKVNCPDTKSILLPKLSASNFSFLFETLVWLPFGINTSLRYRYKCQMYLEPLYMVSFFIIQLFLNLVFISANLHSARSPKSSKRKLLDVTGMASEFIIILMWFASMGLQSTFPIITGVFIIVLIIRCPYVFFSPDKDETTSYVANDVAEGDLLSLGTY